MALKITREQFETMQKRVETAKAAVGRARERTEEIVATVVRTGEVTGAAAMCGLINGRTGGLEVLGAPVDLASGLGLHVLGLLGGAGRYSEHVHSIADGALASYATTLGTSVGARMRREALAGRPGGGGGGSVLPQGGGAAAGALPNEMIGAADRAMANALAHMARG